MRLIDWMVKKMDVIQTKRKINKLSSFYKFQYKIDRSTALKEKSILCCADFTSRKKEVSDGKKDDPKKK